MSRRQQHDMRLVEMNNLLSHGAPTEGALKRMKELYHTISVRHLSEPNVGKYMQVADYLKRRENGMDHAKAYRTSILYSEEDKMKNLSGTKSAKRSIRTRLQDKALVSTMENMLKEQLAMAEAVGMPKEMFHIIMNHTVSSMGYRHEFTKSLLKAGVITEMPARGGGAGKPAPEAIMDTPEFDAIIESAVKKSMVDLIDDPSK